MAVPSHFEGEDVIITFEKEYIVGDSTTRTLAIKNVDGKVLSWNLSGGAKSTEDVFAFGGKTFNFSKPREKFTVSFEIMVNNTDFDFVNMGAEETLVKNSSAGAIGSMSGIVTKSTDAQRRWRIIFWFQDSASHVSNTTKTVTVPGKTTELYRMIFVDCKSISFDKEFSADEYMKGTLNFEFSSSDDKGFANLIKEQGIHTATTTGPKALHNLTSSTTSGIMAEARGYLDWSATTTPAWLAAATATSVTNRYRT